MLINMEKYQQLVFFKCTVSWKNKILLENILNNTNLNINFQTSLDGLKDFHNFNRKVPKSYESVISTIKMINDLKTNFKNRLGRVVIGIAISRSNLKDLSRLIDELEPLNCFLAFGFVRKVVTFSMLIKNTVILTLFLKNFTGWF